MAAHIGQQYLSRAFCLQLRSQYLYLYAWYNPIGALLPVQRYPITYKRNQGHDDDNLDRMSCRAKSTDDLRHEIAKDEYDCAIGERIEAGAQEVEPQELREPHFHAPSQRRGHRAHPRNELVDQQRESSTFIERFRGAQNASFRIDRNLAQKFQDRPPIWRPRMQRSESADNIAATANNQTAGPYRVPAAVAAPPATRA